MDRDRSQVALRERAAAGGNPPAALARRVIVESVQPQIDNGRFPIKHTPAKRSS